MMTVEALTTRSPAGPAAVACASCPYRQDTPSGVWDASEYAKLERYDRETGEQPAQVFLCHQQTGRMCAGWVGCHDMSHSLALRLAAMTGAITAAEMDTALDYVSPVPLWASGALARTAGEQDLAAPDVAAQRVIATLTTKRDRRNARQRSTVS